MKLITIGMIKMFLSKKGRTPCHYLNFNKIVFLFTNVLNPECILHKAFLFVNLIS